MNGRELKDFALLLSCLTVLGLAVSTGEFKRFYYKSNLLSDWLDYPSHSYMGLQSQNNWLQSKWSNKLACGHPVNLTSYFHFKFFWGVSEKICIFHWGWQWICNNRSLMIKSSSCFESSDIQRHFEEKVTKHTMTKVEKINQIWSARKIITVFPHHF